MTKKVKLILLIFIGGGVFLLFSGCALIRKGPQINTLRQLGRSQEEMERHIKEGAENFCKLEEDINQNKLMAGISYQKIISAYGKPVLTWDLSGENLRKKMLYRHPTGYFDSNRVYLYFDQNLKLDKWDYRLSRNN